MAKGQYIKGKWVENANSLGGNGEYYTSLEAARAAHTQAVGANNSDTSKANKTATDHFQKNQELQKIQEEKRQKGEDTKITDDDLNKADALGQAKSDEYTNVVALPEPTKLAVTKNEGINNDYNYTSLLKEYGNNFFELTTYDPSLGTPGGVFRMSGILKQLPSFSMSTKWGEGAAASVSETVKKFFTSDAMEIGMTLGGYDRTWVNIDEGSDRSYEGVTEPTFDLEFRVYTSESIGTKNLTTWKNWLIGLTLFAQPSVSNKVSINAMGNNVVNGVLMSLDKIVQVKDSFVSALKNNDEENDNYVDKVLGLENVVSKVVDDAAVYVTSRDDMNRVTGEANKKSYYGAKLWKLRLLPGIIQKPIIVYVNNWSITYSKERRIYSTDTENGSQTKTEPYYIDFKINCVLDQTPNASTWMYYLDKDYYYKQDTKGSRDTLKNNEELQAYNESLMERPSTTIKDPKGDRKYHTEQEMKNKVLKPNQKWKYDDNGWWIEDIRFSSSY